MIINAGEDNISDGLSWAGVGFRVYYGVSQVFLNLIDVKGGVYKAYSATVIKRFDDQVRIRTYFFEVRYLL